MARRFYALVWLCSSFSFCHAAVTLAGSHGLTVTVDASGTYDIFVPDTAWRFTGKIGARLLNIVSGSGADAAGDYNEVAFDFQTDAPRHAVIRSYYDRMAVLFTFSCASDAANTFNFPSFFRYPKGLGHLTYSGMFAHPTFSALSDDSPWVFFNDAANTFIVSPAANFMTGSTAWTSNGELGTGISTKIGTLPQGFTHQALLVIDNGINRAFETWGQTLTALYGKQRPASDADTSLRLLGYWTDAGSSYYYHTEAGLSYPTTLEAVKSDFDRRGITLGYLQLDSWFYPKGSAGDWTDRAGGMYGYFAAPPLFGMTLAAFQHSLGVPLITHARWIDAGSPYRQQYQMSGNVSTDPAYWAEIARFLNASGAATYEQDWLSDRAQTAFNLTDPDAFLDNMSRELSRQNLTMQYCMATTRHFLQGAKYSNLTSIRASEDRFDNTRWISFLYASRLASALGSYPFTDVLMSSETGNLLLATLSAGPVGIGDRLGAINTANLLRAVRPDGVIVKPDVPLTPLDSSFIAASHSNPASTVASTYTDFGGARAGYVFAYGDGATFRPSELGFEGPVYDYDYVAATGRLIDAGDVIAPAMADGWSYHVVSPLGKSGVAIIGDTGNFVTLGKTRVTAMNDDGAVHLTVAFARGERWRTIQGYSPDPPVVSAGRLQYDAATGRFTVTLSPAAGGSASVDIFRGEAPFSSTGPGGSERIGRSPGR